MFVLQVAMVKGRGGIATAIAHYERMFRAVGVRSTVLYSGPPLVSVIDEGADIIQAPRLLSSPIAGLLPLLGDLPELIHQRTRGDRLVVIVHSDLALPALRRIAPRATFVTPCHSDKFKHKHRADLVVTLNADQDAAARRALPRVRVAKLGNPYIPQALNAPRAMDAQPRFNFVARFTPTKDPLSLVQAAALLSPSPNVRFFGDGELVHQTRSLAVAQGVQAEFVGWDEQPFERFHGNDILVLPSHWEGLPYLLQEALDHGIPTIASDIAGNRTALGDGAYGSLFPPSDAGALAQIMRHALDDLDALRRKAEEGRAALSERYGAHGFWRALSAELVNVDRNNA